MTDSGLESRTDELADGQAGSGPALPGAFAGETTEYPADGARVQLAYCHEYTVSHSWHQSLLNLMMYDKALGENHLQSAPIMVFCSGPNGLVEGRNLAVRRFLDETDDDWLFWVDTDMGFDPDSLERLVLAADPVERPIVGGLCFAMKHQAPDGRGGYLLKPLPTLFGLMKHPDQGIGFVNRMVYPENSMVQVAGTGSAFILIHRSVLTKLREVHGDEWYDLVSYRDGAPVSEDLSFCWRAGMAGFPLFVHTGIGTTHHKQVWVDDSYYVMPDKEPIYRSTKTGVEGYYDQAAPVPTVVARSDTPEGMDPTKWASMNRVERRRYRQARHRVLAAGQAVDGA